MLGFWICLLFLHVWQVFENALSSKFSRVLNLAESWICKGYFGTGLNMEQFSSLMPEHVSIYLNVPQYVWTWLNIAEYHWTFLNTSKKLLWLYHGSAMKWCETVSLDKFQLYFNSRQCVFRYFLFSLSG